MTDTNTDTQKLAKCPICGCNGYIDSESRYREGFYGRCASNHGCLCSRRQLTPELAAQAWNTLCACIETGRAVHKKAEDLAGEWQINLNDIISLCEPGQNPCVKCHLHRASPQPLRWQDVMGELRDVIAVPLSVVGLDKRLLLAKIDAVLAEPEENNDGKE